VPVSPLSLVDEDQRVFPGAAGLPAPWQTTRRTPLTHSCCQHVVTAASAHLTDRPSGHGHHRLSRAGLGRGRPGAVRLAPHALDQRRAPAAPDGLIGQRSTRRSIEEGIDRLVDDLRRLGPLPLEQVLDGLVGSGRTSRDDDIAVLGMRTRSTSPTGCR
jgi:hypothetical protein